MLTAVQSRASIENATAFLEIVFEDGTSARWAVDDETAPERLREMIVSTTGHRGTRVRPGSHGDDEYAEITFPDGSALRWPLSTTAQTDEVADTAEEILGPPHTTVV